MYEVPFLPLGHAGTHDSHRLVAHEAIERYKADKVRSNKPRSLAEHFKEVLAEYEEIRAANRASGKKGGGRVSKTTTTTGKAPKRALAEEADEEMDEEEEDEVVAPAPAAPLPQPLPVAGKSRRTRRKAAVPAGLDAPVMPEAVDADVPAELKAIYEQLKGLEEPAYTTAFNKLMGEYMSKQGVSADHLPGMPTDAELTNLQMGFAFEPMDQDDAGDNNNFDDLFNQDFFPVVEIDGCGNDPVNQTNPQPEPEPVAVVCPLVTKYVWSGDEVHDSVAECIRLLPEALRTEVAGLISVPAAEAAVEVATVVAAPLAPDLVDLATVAAKSPHLSSSPAAATVDRSLIPRHLLFPEALPRRLDGTVTLGPTAWAIEPASSSDNSKQKAALVDIIKASTPRTGPVAQKTVMRPRPAAQDRDESDDEGDAGARKKAQGRKRAEPPARAPATVVVVDEGLASPTVVRKKRASEKDMLQVGYWEKGSSDPWNFNIPAKNKANCPLGRWAK